MMLIMEPIHKCTRSTCDSLSIAQHYTPGGCSSSNPSSSEIDDYMQVMVKEQILSTRQ